MAVAGYKEAEFCIACYFHNANFNFNRPHEVSFEKKWVRAFESWPISLVSFTRLSRPSRNNMWTVSFDINGSCLDGLRYTLMWCEEPGRSSGVWWQSALAPSANGFEKGRGLSWSDSVPQGPSAVSVTVPRDPLKSTHTRLKRHCSNHNRKLTEFNVTFAKSH